MAATLYDGVRTDPEMLVGMACAWAAKDYPLADGNWMRLVRLCERAMADGWKRIRRGDLFVIAAQQGMDMTLCREFCFDNNLWAPLSRYLLMFRPKLAAVIFPKRQKTSRIDEVDFVAAWHEQVNPATFFYYPTWEEAVEAWHRSGPRDLQAPEAVALVGRAHGASPPLRRIRPQSEGLQTAHGHLPQMLASSRQRR